MAKVSCKRNCPPLECVVSDIALLQGEGSSCCDPLFMYEPIVLDFGDTTEGLRHRNEILESEAEALHIKTQFQNIWLLGVTEMELQEQGKLGVKFENCIVI